MPKPEFESRIKELFDMLPVDLALREEAAVELLSGFRRNVADYLLPAVQKSLAAPPTSFVEKQKTADKLNSLLHNFGLGIHHPSMPACCSVTPTRNQKSESGWLRLVQRKATSGGTTHARSVPTNKLSIEELTLVEAPFALPGPHRRSHK